MGNPIFRFTLRHEVLGDLEISEPIGWVDANLTLERHEDYNSLVEYFYGSFTFYGTDGVIDGGIDRIRLVEQTYGPDATLVIIIEASFDSGYNYVTIFQGQLDLTTIKENMLNQAEVAIIRDDFWAKFISRKSTPVSLTDISDLDGNAIVPADPVNLTLTSQILNESYQAENLPADVPFFDDIPDDSYLQLGYANEILDEIEETFHLPQNYNDQLPVGNITATYGGEYTFAIEVYVYIQRTSVVSGLQFFEQSVKTFDGDYVDFYLRINGADYTFAWSDIVVGPSYPFDQGGTITKFSISGTYSVNKGSDILFYGKMNQAFTQPPGADTYLFFWNAIIAGYASRATILARTVFDPTRSRSFLIHDAAANILKGYGLGESNPLYSEFFGSQFTQARAYDSNGCGWKNTLTKGLQLRGYTLDEKIFSQSFEQWWSGANPIFNLGLGYETIDIEEDIIPQPDQQFVVDTSFNDPSKWPQIGSGDDWTVSSGEASVILTGFSSKSMHQFFSGAGLGTYDYLYFRQTTGLNVGVDSINLAVTLYDNMGLAVGGFVEFISTNLSGGFALSIPVTGIPVELRITAQQNSGGGGNRVSIQSLTIDGPSAPIIIPAEEAQIIRIEERDHFYDTGPTSIDFDNVIDIDREYDTDYLLNKIEIGYSQWQSENISGIDDPQTKHTYTDRFQKIGKGVTLYSDFIGASLAHEVTRRQLITKSKDYKFDNETFITAINPDDTSPDSYIPELDENFSSITGLLNPQSRYNSRLTPARNLLRWLNVIQIGLQSYIGSLFKFVSGEGNYSMVSNKDNDGCSGDFTGPLGESQNIPVTDDHIHLPYLYNINIPMPYESYATIAANRKKAIGISQSDSGHVKFYIKKLQYSICKSQATIQAWPADYLQIGQTDFVMPDRNCGGSPCGEDARLTSDGDFRVTSDGECRITV